MKSLFEHLFLTVLFFLLTCCPAHADAPANQPRIQTIITTECGEYFTWQSLGFFYGFKKIGQIGNLTRVMCCTPDAAKNNPYLQIVPTHVAPDYTEHPTNGDIYQAYNKPVAVIDYLDKVKPDIDYLLVIDADMVMMRIMDPAAMGVKPGHAVAAHFGYMQGTYNELADKHIPEIPRRNDTLAGHLGRRSDDCGGFTIMTLPDIQRVAPLWLKYTEDVRMDPDAWRLTGDVYATKPGLRPWIAEMYGYSYGAAKAGVWHFGHRTGMVYPGDEMQEAPYVMHYGLEIKIPNTDYQFDKHSYLDFNALLCPPWDLDQHEKSAGGLFKHPPLPSLLKTENEARYRDVHAIATINTLNEAFCEQHYLNCPPSEELDTECGRVHVIAMDVHDELVALEAKGMGQCKDVDGWCEERARKNECKENADYTAAWCRKTCGECKQEKWDRIRYVAEWQKKFVPKEAEIKAEMVLTAESKARDKEENNDSNEGAGDLQGDGDSGDTPEGDSNEQTDKVSDDNSDKQEDTTGDDSSNEQGDTGGDDNSNDDKQGDSSNDRGDSTDTGDTRDSSKSDAQEEDAGQGRAIEQHGDATGLEDNRRPQTDRDANLGGKETAEGGRQAQDEAEFDSMGDNRRTQQGDADEQGGGGTARRMTHDITAHQHIEDLGLGHHQNWTSLVLQIHGFGAVMWIGLFALFIMLAPRVRRGRTPPRLKPRRLTYDQLERAFV